MKRAAVPSILVVVVLVAVAVIAEAQQPTKVPRIGFFSSTSPSTISARVEAFRQGLRELGYVEGKNIVIEWRYAEGKLDRLPALAAELVRLKVDVIVSAGPGPTRSAKQARVRIPIVMAFDDDPVGSGFAAGLARPGGNITGLSTLAPEISGKQLELLKEIAPKLSRVAVLGNATQPGHPQALREINVAADGLVLGGPVLFSQRKQVIELALKSRLPTIYARPEYVEDGGLVFYGPSYTDLFRRAATYVDKILKGAKPADLPVEQPKKFELIINLKTAKQIDVMIPPNVLVRADKVIK
jgi:ABC-type uncharacterized transport system substrate-binding protein